MKKYMLAMLLTVGIGANPTMCNDVKSKEQVKKEKKSKVMNRDFKKY